MPRGRQVRRLVGARSRALGRRPPWPRIRHGRRDVPVELAFHASTDRRSPRRPAPSGCGARCASCSCSQGACAGTLRTGGEWFEAIGSAQPHAAKDRGTRSQGGPHGRARTRALGARTSAAGPARAPRGAGAGRRRGACPNPYGNALARARAVLVLTASASDALALADGTSPRSSRAASIARLARLTRTRWSRASLSRCGLWTDKPRELAAALAADPSITALSFVTSDAVPLTLRSTDVEASSRSVARACLALGAEVRSMQVVPPGGRAMQEPAGPRRPSTRRAMSVAGPSFQAGAWLALRRIGRRKCHRDRRGVRGVRLDCVACRTTRDPPRMRPRARCKGLPSDSPFRSPSLAVVACALGRERLDAAMQPTALIGANRRGRRPRRHLWERGHRGRTRCDDRLRDGSSGARTAVGALDRPTRSRHRGLVRSRPCCYAFLFGAASTFGARGGGRVVALLADLLIGPAREPSCAAISCGLTRSICWGAADAVPGWSQTNSALGLVVLASLFAIADRSTRPTMIAHGSVAEGRRRKRH